MTPSQLQKKLEKAIGGSTSGFSARASVAQSQMWQTVLIKVRELEIDSLGNLLATTKNLKLLSEIKAKLKSAIITTEYKKGVGNFLASFGKVRNISNEFLGVTRSSSAVVANYNLSIEAAKNSLLASGIDQAVIAPVENILKQNITSGGALSDLTESLRLSIMGDSGVDGRLQRYAAQITKDSLNQFNANHTLAVANDLGMEFYVYEGTLQDNSRQYCIDMIGDGRWFHIKEIEESASREWKGKIQGTNGSNILINRGGYQCNHQFIPVSIEAVPTNVVERARAKGFLS